MSSRIYIVLAAFLALAINMSAFSQEVLVTRLKPDLPIYPQYFSVVQGNQGSVYLGHSQAVLRFDGNRWETIALPTPGAVRVLDRAPNGRVWVGGTNSFGYLQRDDTGADQFVDLTPAFASALGDEQFADIWRMSVTHDTVFFGALHHLFAVSIDGSKKGLWRHEGRFGAVAQVGEHVYVQWRGQGLKKLQDNGQFTMVAGGAAFADSLIRNLIPLDNGKALVHTFEPALYLWSPGAEQSQFQRLEVGQPAQLSSLTDGRAVNANTVAFGGSDGVVRVLDVAAGTFEQAPISRSFLNGPAFADDGALLLASDDGVSRLPWPASWTRYGSETGLKGAVHQLKELRSHLYAMTEVGVYRAQLTDGALTSPFEKTSWLEHRESWDLIDSKVGLVIAAAHDLRLVSGDTTQRIGPDGLYPRRLLVTPDQPDILWSGNEHGLAVFSLSDDQWQLADQVVQLGMRVTSLVPAAGGGVWVGTDASGLKKATVNTDGTLALSLQPATATMPGSQFAAGADAYVSRSRLGLLVSTSNGIYRFDGIDFVADDLGGLSDFKPAGETVTFMDSADGTAWAHSYRALYSRRAGLWSVTDLSSLNSGAVDVVTSDNKGSLWIGGAGEVFHYQPEAMASASAGSLGLSALIRVGVEGQPDQRLPLLGDLDLQGSRVSLRASFLLTDLEQAGSTIFRSRLLGLSDQWSPWSKQGEVSFLALQPGTYTLQAEARTGTGRVFVLPSKGFSVVPQWFESAWFRGIAILCFFSLMLVSATLLQRRQVKRLAARNSELDGVVQQRTQELRAANLKLRDQAERDALTGVGNRRLFDKRLDECFDDAHDNAGAMALLMVDVDHFKRYNDAHGHQAGDWVLSKLASVLSDNVRSDTVVARYGGEEFAIIVPGCDNLSAARLARRLVRQVESEVGEVTISIGVAGYNSDRDHDPDVLVGRADEALYSAKRQGRNRFVLAA